MYLLPQPGGAYRPSTGWLPPWRVRPRGWNPGPGAGPRRRCGCGCGGRGRRRTLGQLPTSATAASGTLSTAQIVAQLCGTNPDYCTVKSGANKQGALQAFLTDAVNSRLVPDPTSDPNAIDVMEADAQTNCSSYAATGAGGSSTATAAKIVSKATPLAVTGITTGAAIAGASIGSVVPVVGTIVGALAGIIAGIFSGAHAKAVAGEQQDICGSVPQINSALQQIDAALAAGQIQPSDASSLYQQLQSQFTQALHQNTTYKAGDALFAYNLALQGVIIARNQDLANGVSSAVGTGLSTTVAGIPLWAILAGAAAVFLM